MPKERHCVVQVGKLKAPAGGREELLHPLVQQSRVRLTGLRHSLTNTQRHTYSKRETRLHIWLFSPVIQAICTLLCVLLFG